MADPVVLAAVVETAVKTLQGVSFFDGNVPKSVPEVGGFILPYVVLWAGIGDNPDELPANGMHDSSTLVWDFQLTVTSADPNICRRVAKDVLALLINKRAGTGRIRPNPDGFNQQAPIPDASIIPSRFMLPLQLRLITN